MLAYVKLYWSDTEPIALSKPCIWHSSPITHWQMCSESNFYSHSYCKFCTALSLINQVRQVLTTDVDYHVLPRKSFYILKKIHFCNYYVQFIFVRNNQYLLSIVTSTSTWPLIWWWNIKTRTIFTVLSVLWLPVYLLWDKERKVIKVWMTEDLLF